MHDTVKTVKVKPWGKDQGDFVEINESDFDGAIHVLLGGDIKGVERDEPSAGKGTAIQVGAGDPPCAPILTVGKGPGGRIYIKDGKSIHSGPFASEDEANAALAEVK